MIDKFKADYNLILNLYWPTITNQIAEDIGTLGKTQVENRKFKSATGGALIN